MFFLFFKIGKTDYNYYLTGQGKKFQQLFALALFNHGPLNIIRVSYFIIPFFIMCNYAKQNMQRVIVIIFKFYCN